MTDYLRESRVADIEGKYLKLNAPRYMNRPFKFRLQAPFVHDDDYNVVRADYFSFVSKYDRRLLRMMSEIKSPPPEGVHSIHHIPKKLPLQETLYDGFAEREANASEQKSKDFFEGRDGVHISPLVEVMPCWHFGALSFSSGSTSFGECFWPEEFLFTRTGSGTVPQTKKKIT